MKILSCVPCQYYNSPGVKTYEYLSFMEVLRKMGHTVYAVDHKVQSKLDRLRFNDFFLSIVKHGNYDLVWIVTHRDQFIPETLDEARRYSILVAWNCDDDWRWENYSSKWAQHYTYMVTTYRHIYEANRLNYPNLLLSQWGCTGMFEGLQVAKDIDISFVGFCYGKRFHQIDTLRRKFSFVTYGKYMRPKYAFFKKIQKCIVRGFRIPWVEKDLILPDQTAVKQIWNRSKISFTPLDNSKGDGLQIKARVFDMGLSGTVMLCSKNPGLYEFYEPGKEFVEFGSMDECVDKVKYLLKNNCERRRIAEAYYKRTKAEHLWRHRFSKLFSQMGLK